ncbi:glutathione S-transferase family protein [Diaphorobacter nitroreducens]|uniref:glutathione S-transferase family protein n=1 Tax=Diaphorobacter nitroreducens TaxID=164759 RepID=UPI0035B40291
MIQLHYYPSTAAMIPHILLEELGVPYERVLVDRAVDAHKAPAYLKLNPNGLLPVLTDGDLVLYETAAIVLHLCDTHPQAALAPAVGTAQRAHFYKWLMWLTNTLQSALIIYFYGERWMDEGNAAGAAELKANARKKVGAMLDQLDAHLGSHGGPWFMGADYIALDAYVFTLCRWTRNFSAAPARERPHLGPYLQRVLARAAVQRVIANEKLSPPFV